jgi:hypothetical protein
VHEFVIKLTIALSFAGACAFAYLRLARGRANVRRESAIIFTVLLLFAAIRLMTTG